ncbi:MAG: nuclear transport factor 2 family protein [Halioglobus sp.]|nr:nuclear transport factor 2 family protein [Halioglobus sp.]
MSDRIEEYLAKQEIYELSCKYMRGLDRHDEVLLKSVFWEDAWCDYGFTKGPAMEFAEFCMSALKDHAANHHMIGNVLVDVEGDEAFGEVYFNAYHKVEGEAGFEDIIIAGRYLDRYEKRDGVWKFAYRSEVVDFSRTRRTQDSYFEQAPDSLRGGRLDDAVYRHDNRRRPTD